MGRGAVLALVIASLAVAGCSSEPGPSASFPADEYDVVVGPIETDLPPETPQSTYSPAVTSGPFVGGPHAVRTYFKDDASWIRLQKAMLAVTPEGFQAQLGMVDDRAFDGLDADEVVAALPAGYPMSFLVIADRDSITLPEHPLLVVDLADPAHPRFRALPSTIQAIENNLSIANMDFEEFSAAVDSDGVFRGF